MPNKWRLIPNRHALLPNREDYYRIEKIITE
ncbi:hypothetical protein J2R98_000194 [Alkalibacillus filiformis]|uniref:Uncharacterized protein n=1 Tax=Alkalibacillus filiformis TaxID=200990 RepID=A0ABU0DPK8_9BACI|nr:hypothetical protein [Alkalibacillus filiformis]